MKSFAQQTKRVADWDHLENPGDYFIKGNQLMILCPRCGSACDLSTWKRESDDPLTISPSVNENNCFHYFIKGGIVTDAGGYD